jgi:hypothetical protein
MEIMHQLSKSTGTTGSKQYFLLEKAKIGEVGISHFTSKTDTGLVSAIKPNQKYIKKSI